MPSIYPQGDDLKKAIQWISDNQKCNPESTVLKLIDEACIRFDLSPEDSEFLLRFFRNSRPES